MKFCTLLSALLVASPLLGLSAAASSEESLDSQRSVAAVQKVIQMLEDMAAKAKEEKQNEEVGFAKFQTWCKMEQAQLKENIKKAGEQIELLKAEITKLTTEAKILGEEIAKLQEDVAGYEAEKKAKTLQREKDNKAFVAESTDYGESLDAIERAITVLMSKSADKPADSAVLLQLAKGDKLPAQAKSMVAAFLGMMGADFMNSMDAAPEANAYEFQSGGVIEMLEKLLDKFIAERTTLEKEEMNSKHAYDMLMQDLKAQIAQATQDRDEKAEFKAGTLQSKADAQGDLQDTTSTRDADQKYLDDLTATCEQKASDFESRQQLRAEEIEAIEKAIEIISSGAVSGNADKHLPGLLQKSALAQLRADTSSQNQARVASYLQKRAETLGSRVLSALAVRVEADPFAKVKKMIKDLIVKLMEEANEEAEHKGWCDTELSTNEQTRKEKTEAVETLHAEIDQLEASIAKLTEDITDLTKAVAELDAAMAKATKLRQEEKATNTETISDSQEAQTAVAQALTVLKEFYAKAAEATALIQQQPESPEIFDKPYQGMGAENGGVIGMLEVIESDFARLEADTKASEASAQKEYDEFMTDSQVDKTKKSTDIEHKTAKKQDEEQALTTKKSDLEGTQKELDAALAYFDKLKPSCVDAGVSYEDRVARRKEEIESLQEALKILNGEDLA